MDRVLLGSVEAQIGALGFYLYEIDHCTVLAGLYICGWSLCRPT